MAVGVDRGNDGVSRLGRVAALRAMGDVLFLVCHVQWQLSWRAAFGVSTQRFVRSSVGKACRRSVSRKLASVGGNSIVTDTEST